MTLAPRLLEYISACFTGLWIQSHEHEDALTEIAQMCRDQEWRLAVWDVERGLHLPGQPSGQAGDAGGNDPLAAIYQGDGAKPAARRKVSHSPLTN